jgi:hypothetical protein
VTITAFFVDELVEGRFPHHQQAAPASPETGAFPNIDGESRGPREGFLSAFAILQVY